MVRALSCYYLDTPLSDAERSLVEEVLLGPWAKFKTGANALSEHRVPNVLPLPDETGHFSQTPEQRASRLRTNLRHAGIMRDAGHQVVWIMPQDTAWDAIFQFAIREETGFGPYVLQRWVLEDRVLRPCEPRIVDTQKLIEGLQPQ
jgi:hypothetical protein